MRIKFLLAKFASLLAAVVLISPVSAQQPSKQSAPPSADTAQSVKKPGARKVVKKKSVEQNKSQVPSLEDRLAEHRMAVRRGEEREPSAAYLIEEMTVTGTYKSVGGYGAFLRATNGRTFFAYSGMRLYDGVVAQIDPDQVVFQQSLPDGKKKQIVKAYDPNALRSASVADQTEREKKGQEKKAKKKEETKEEPEEGDAGKKDE